MRLAFAKLSGRICHTTDLLTSFQCWPCRLIPFHFDLNVDFLKNVNQCAKEFGYCIHFCFLCYNHAVLNLLPAFDHNFALFRFILNLLILVLIMTSVKKAISFFWLSWIQITSLLNSKSMGSIKFLSVKIGKYLSNLNLLPILKW